MTQWADEELEFHAIEADGVEDFPEDNEQHSFLSWPGSWLAILAMFAGVAALCVLAVWHPALPPAYLRTPDPQADFDLYPPTSPMSHYNTLVGYQARPWPLSTGTGNSIGAKTQLTCNFDTIIGNGAWSSQSCEVLGEHSPKLKGKTCR